MPESAYDGTAQEIIVAPTATVLRPLAVDEQLQAMKLYQDGLQSILDESDWQEAGRGERFVKKSGWRKIAAWFGLSLELVRDHVDRAEDGSVQRAQVWARAIAPNGRYADADGYCDVSESRFARNKAKLENDLRGTATTRAINRAISNLVGMGAVSHEEMVAAADAPSFGPAASEAQASSLRRAIAYVLDEDTERTETVFVDIAAKAGYLPAIVVHGVGVLARALKELRELPDRESDVTDDALIDEALREREAAQV